jgi:hypothetical protein
VRRPHWREGGESARPLPLAAADQPAPQAPPTDGGWQFLAGSRTAPGEFNQPAGLALDCQGNLYVADTGNQRIQKLPAGAAR